MTEKSEENTFEKALNSFLRTEVIIGFNSSRRVNNNKFT